MVFWLAAKEIAGKTDSAMNRAVRFISLISIVRQSSHPTFSRQVGQERAQVIEERW